MTKSISNLDQKDSEKITIGGPSPGRIDCPRRIRLVAYGARLESVLGASPRGFESPILRQQLP
ncbi:MAG: hypothetical protein RLZZ122_719 [Actinomycetota bacterium]